MGLITYQPTSNIIVRLREKFDIQFAVETGTYMGEATAWLAERFPKVFTVDISKEFQNQAKVNCANFTNIKYVIGDSRTALAKVVSKLTGPAIFWLDAHNTHQVYGPGPDDCPLVEELTAIFKSEYKHFLLVDDMNILIPFERRVHHPAGPVDVEKWPHIDILKALAEENGYTIGARIDQDVMAIVPVEYTDELQTDFYDKV